MGTIADIQVSEKIMAFIVAFQHCGIATDRDIKYKRLNTDCTYF
jgi:hypothetical protein